MDAKKKKENFREKKMERFRQIKLLFFYLYICKIIMMDQSGTATRVTGIYLICFHLSMSLLLLFLFGSWKSHAAHSDVHARCSSGTRHCTDHTRAAALSFTVEGKGVENSCWIAITGASSFARCQGHRLFWKRPAAAILLT
jgi:hypothetical protein